MSNFTEHFAHPSLRWGSQMYAWLEEIKHPIIRLGYPKELRVPRGYTDPRFFVFQAYASALLMKTESDAASNKTLVCAYAVNNALIRYQVPTFFIGADLLCAVAASDAPEDMLVSELNWPAKAMLLMLPSQQSKQVANDHEVIYISMTKTTASTSTKAPFDVVLPSGVSVPSRHVDIYNTFAGEWLLMNSVVVDRDGTPAEYHAILPITDAKVKDWFVYDIKFYPFADSPHIAVPFDQEIDGAVAERLKQIAIQTLLAFNAAPELFEREQIIRAGKKDYSTGKVVKRALWSPNFIGRTYRLPTASPGTGEHASPRAHYRRGHFRNQRVGPRIMHPPQRKLIWLQPVFVGV